MRKKLKEEIQMRGMGNMQGMMKQMQKMQKQMAEAQEKLGEERLEGASRWWNGESNRFGR